MVDNAALFGTGIGGTSYLGSQLENFGAGDSSTSTTSPLRERRSPMIHRAGCCSCRTAALRRPSTSNNPRSGADRSISLRTPRAADCWSHEFKVRREQGLWARSEVVGYPSRLLEKRPFARLDSVSVSGRVGCAASGIWPMQPASLLQRQFVLLSKDLRLSRRRLSVCRVKPHV